MTPVATALRPNLLETGTSASPDDAELRAELGTGNGIKMHYQPIVDAGGKVVCVEALMRLSRAGGLVPPLQLIGQVRRLGLLTVLGGHVQRLALHEFATHHTLHGFPKRIAINVAAEEFSASGFADRVLHQIALCNLAPEQVTLEITEDAPLAQTADVSNALHDLASAGVRLSLDDFGSGNNGFSSLLRMRFHQIKLDKCFMPRLRAGDVLVSGMIQTAQKMGLEVVCEGVETREQAEILRDLGCTLFQGFYFGRPGDLAHLGTTLG